jgi:hypothetical protein
LPRHPAFFHFGDVRKLPEVRRGHRIMRGCNAPVRGSERKIDFLRRTPLEVGLIGHVSPSAQLETDEGLQFIPASTRGTFVKCSHNVGRWVECRHQTHRSGCWRLVKLYRVAG